ncbi:MAG: dipeptide ABC transporter ATP-binding protein [Hyphomicrobiaceae bacterium]|nr:dipeptide ABC transporter ATP-binding protein [Hyphomicrobiaceae bacterium]
MTSVAKPGSVLLEARGLSKHYPVRRGLVLRREVGQVRAVDGVSLDLRRGETLAVVGESGCGKSTLARLLLRLIEATSGSITFDGVELGRLDREAMRRMRRRMQMIFQDPYASLNPRLSIRRILIEPMALHLALTPDELEREMQALLKVVGLQPFHADRFPHEFSGGQRQRIGIARALATKPELVVCDEPVSALDVSIQAHVINLLEDLKREFHLSYVFIAHDLAVVRHIADRIAVMYLGEIVEIGDKRELTGAPRHPYTRALLSAVPFPDPGSREPKPVLQGDVPSPLQQPPGCKFHPRCPFAVDRCKAERPVLRRLPGGIEAACHRVEELPAWTPRRSEGLSPAVAARQAALANAARISAPAEPA